jgi:hypothetical protein
MRSGIGDWLRLGCWLSRPFRIDAASPVLLLGWFLVRIGGFGGSVPVVVLMFAEQPQSFGGLGEDAEGFGAPHIYWVGVTAPDQNVGDPIDGGFEPDGITSGGPGNDQL